MYLFKYWMKCDTYNKGRLSLQSGTYVPASVIGSPRQLRDKCANALACYRRLGKTVLFITMTTDLKDWQARGHVHLHGLYWR